MLSAYTSVAPTVAEMPSIPNGSSDEPASTTSRARTSGVLPCGHSTTVSPLAWV